MSFKYGQHTNYSFCWSWRICPINMGHLVNFQTKSADFWPLVQFFFPCVHFYGCKYEVIVLPRELLWKPHLTSERSEGTQPCSALDNLWSGTKREQSQAHRERESSSAHLYVRLQLHERWAHLTDFCLAALHHRKWSNRSLTEGLTRKTWLANKHAGVFGTVITWGRNVICCCFLLWLIVTSVLIGREFMAWEVLFFLLVVQNRDGNPDDQLNAIVASDLLGCSTRYHRLTDDMLTSGGVTLNQPLELLTRL